MMSTRTMNVASAILTVSFISIASQAFAATQTLNGVISDTMCVKKHMMPGKSDSECIKECIKSGSAYVLVVGDKSYTLKGKAAAIAPFAGKRATVQGTVDQKTINVEAIH
jgi:hypothetical protein